jgi:zinc and cadmium transporter
MSSAALPAILSVVAVSLVSLTGASLLFLGRARVDRLLPALVALAAGALLGDAFLHLLPEAVERDGGFSGRIAWGALGGLLGFFVIEQAIHWHHHGEDIGPGAEGVHSVAWMNLLGDLLHNAVDGMLIAGAWLVSPEAGLATTFAVALHEVPQEFGDFGVLVHAGLPPRRALLLNLLSAAAALLGAVLVLLVEGAAGLEGVLAPIAAGGFLYVACADLVPELRKRADRGHLVRTCLALGAGVVLMALIGAHGDGAHHGHDHPH